MKFSIKKHNTENYAKTKRSGFTLIETLVAVFILTIALNGLFALIANSLFSARYARNEITANYLMQEAIDYIRNDRDTTVFQNMSPTSWSNFLGHYGYPSGLCFAGGLDSRDGCEIDLSNIDPATGRAVVSQCNTPRSSTFGETECRVLNYDDNASNRSFYNYQSGSLSNFKRQVLLWIDSSGPNGTFGADELQIKVTVEWQNGGVVRSRSLQTTLLNWQN